MRSVITSEGLSKSYNISQQTDVGYPTLRESIVRFLSRDHVATARETFWALRDVDLTIHEGEKVGIIGRNGAGKSTLLKLLSRITTPTRGRVKLVGRMASLLEVGTGFHPELTGRENIYLNGAILGMRRAQVRRRFDQIVDFAEVEQFLDTPVKRYSSGMYTRLAFAVAAHLDSDILLLDEVLAVGDAIFQKKCLGRINDLRDAGRTILLVSHNMESIQSSCERAILLEQGSVVLDGPVNQTLERYMQGFSREIATQSVEDMPRTGDLGKHVRITDCRVLNSRGVSTDKLYFGEPFSVRLKLRSHSTLSQATLLVELNAIRSGLCITTFNTEVEQLDLDGAYQELEISVAVNELQLRPGLYSVTPGIRRGRFGLDHVPSAIAFEVLPVSAAGAVLDANVWGVIQSPGVWSTCDH